MQCGRLQFAGPKGSCGVLYVELQCMEEKSCGKENGAGEAPFNKSAVAARSVRLLVVADAAALVTDGRHECFLRHRVSAAGLGEVIIDRGDRSFFGSVEYLLAER